MLFFIIPLIYIMVGMIVARQTYALQLHTYNSSDAVRKVVAAREDLAKINHESSCYQRINGSYYNPNRPCDCYSNNTKALWRSKQSSLNSLIAVAPKKPSNPYKIMFLYPAIAVDAWVRGGKVKSGGVNHDEIARLERELEIGK